METITMSKMGNYVFDMQEDAAWMSRHVFIQKHGIYAEHFFDDFHKEDELEPDFDMEMDDGA